MKKIKIDDQTDIASVHDDLAKQGHPDCRFVFSTRKARERFNDWLGKRLGIEPAQLA